MPGGPPRNDHGGVGSHAVFDVLRRADEAAELPRLGGMARANGVVVVSERYWAFASSDGELREAISWVVTLHTELRKGSYRLDKNSDLVGGRAMASAEALYGAAALAKELGIEK